MRYRRDETVKRSGDFQNRHCKLCEDAGEITLKREKIYYPLCVIFDPYRGIYGAGYILFVYNDASVPWITSVNKFRFFTNILETNLPTNMFCRSLKGHLTVLLLMSVAFKSMQK